MSSNKATFDKLVVALKYKRMVRYTDGRAKKLSNRLKAFSEEELLLACRALTDNDYMMGDDERNTSNTRYATIDYLLRSDEITEKWLEQAEDSTGNIDLSTFKF